MTKECERDLQNLRPWLYSTGDKSRLYGVYFGNEPGACTRGQLNDETELIYLWPASHPGLAYRFAYSLVWTRRPWFVSKGNY